MPQGEKKKKQKRHFDSVFRYAKSLKFGEILFKIDPETDLFAIIAIHSIKRGPAIGGCRFRSYDSVEDAVVDAIRLSQMMSYKAAACNLPHGGAKAVIVKPKNFRNRKALFEKFGEFVNQQQGRYITAVDSGTTVEDMDIISTRTPYLTCTTFGGYGGDPSPQTAHGVTRGIEAAVKFKLGKDNLAGLHIAIQGAGHVGYSLAKELIELGAKVSITDIHSEAIKKCVDELGVNPISDPDAIYDLPCDVFSPCALGAVLNSNTIPRLKTPIVAGSTNNQLEHNLHGQALFERNILYVPDFIINSGGLIYVAAIYDHGTQKKAQQQIDGLYDTLMNLFERAKKENCPTNIIAEKIAKENLGE